MNQVWMICMLCVLAPPNTAGLEKRQTIIVGSKKFTESVILGEIATALAVSKGVVAEHKREMGGTRIVFNSLAQGQIDIYPEYTGTIIEEILATLKLKDEKEMRAALDKRGIRMTESLGFNNTYAIGMKRQTTRRLSVNTISDLRKFPELRFGFTNEFMERADGWPALRRSYNLPQPPQNVRGLDHDIALRALKDGSIDATDLYSTDAEIAYYQFHVLEDDLSYFPRYDALFLYRSDLETRAPQVVRSLHAMAGRIDETYMIKMNKLAKIEKKSEGEVAAGFLRDVFGIHVMIDEETFLQRQIRLLVEHLNLVIKSMALAVVVAIPLGIVAAKRFRIGQGILGIVGIFQTIPALALLVFLMPLPWPRETGRPDILGIGDETAIVALFLYCLLPIVRNTQTGLLGIDLSVRESAEALGLSAWSKLMKVELPLASRTILAGIKTAAVMAVGFATLGAFIYAGGYGQPILAGLRRDEMGTILEGAVPAALLALLAQGLFELADRFLVPLGLRLKPTG